jgi:hypothetical protein
MNKLLPVFGILAGITLLLTTLANTAAAQDIIEFTLLNLFNNAHFKNQGQCISQFPDIISNAHIISNASPLQIKEIAKTFCKQRLPT